MMDALIFDLDGTLWDSRASVIASWRESCLRLTGAPLVLSDSECSALFGKPMDVIAEALLPHCAPAERHRLAESVFEEENRYLLSHPGVLFPGVEDSLRTLSSRYPLYIVSNCQRGYIDVFFQVTGLRTLFRGDLCFGDTGTSKGVTIRTLMERFGISSAVYVGDTAGDQTASAEAGLPFVYAAYGFGSAELPSHTIQSFSQLTTLF